ncbi:MAG: CopG family transcriptional regulator [Myxococcota bacterium]
MRTTVTLDPDVATRLKALAHERHESFKAVLNAVLRRGLDAPEGSEGDGPYVVEPHHGGFRPGVDPGRLNQLLDELEVEDFEEEPRADT